MLSKSYMQRARSPFAREQKFPTAPLTSPRATRSHPTLTTRRTQRSSRFRTNVPRNKAISRSSGPKSGLRHSVNNATVSDVAWLAQKAWQGVKVISSLINVEQKLFDVSGSGAFANTGVIGNLSNIAEGSDYNNRDGLSILTQRLDMAFYFTNNSSSNSTFLRLMIFRDNDQRGTDPAVAEVLQTNTVISPMLNYTEKRFDVLHDSLHSMSIGGANCGTQKVGLKLYKHIYYSSTSGADASNFEGALYYLIISDQATNTPTVTFHSRLQFTDN
jgi:hypothetical protein